MDNWWEWYNGSKNRSLLRFPPLVPLVSKKRRVAASPWRSPCWRHWRPRDVRIWRQPLRPSRPTCSRSRSDLGGYSWDHAVWMLFGIGAWGKYDYEDWIRFKQWIMVPHRLYAQLLRSFDISSQSQTSQMGVVSYLTSGRQHLVEFDV